jgi:hypothetical protein
MLHTMHWLLVEWRYYLKLPKYEVKISPHLSATQDNPREAQRHHPFIDVSQPGPYGDRFVHRVAGYPLNQCHLCSTEFKMNGAECGRNLFASRTSVWQDFGDCSYLCDPNCKHYRKRYNYRTSLGSASPPRSIKVEFEESCPDSHKLGRLDLPKDLYLTKVIKMWIKDGVGTVGYRYSRSYIVTLGMYWSRTNRIRKSTNPRWWYIRRGQKSLTSAALLEPGSDSEDWGETAVAYFKHMADRPWQ